MSKFLNLFLIMALQTSNSSLERMCDSYSLGTLVSDKPLSGGDVNYNSLIETSKGNYVQRILGANLTPEKRESLGLEFAVLEGLSKGSFSLEVPTPIRNDEGSFLDESGTKPYWVYKFLEGDNGGKKLARIDKIAGALANYHGEVSSLDIPKNPEESFFNPDWLKQDYLKMGSLEPRSKLDKTMKKYLGLFEGIRKEVSSINYEGNLLPTHGDFSKDNLLFDRSGNVTGVIDFDDIKIAPRIRDISNAMMYSCFDGNEFNSSKYDGFLKAYESEQELEDVERELLKPAILRELLSVFSWYYNANEKQPEESIQGLEDTYKKSKSLKEVIL